MIKKLIFHKSITIFLLLAIAISSFFSIQHWKGHERWKWMVCMDGRGYYAYLPAIFIYHDKSYSFYEKMTTIEGDLAIFFK